MATINKRLTEGTVLTASAVTQYTAPALTKCIIKKVTICNTTAAPQTCTIYLVPNAGTAGAANTVLSAKTIPANSVYEAFECENHVLEAGDFIQALASAISSLTFAASGIEVS